LGCLQRIAAFSFCANAGEDQSFDTEVAGLVSDLVVSELGTLYELFPALVGLGLEGGEDAIARSLSSTSPCTGLLGIQIHVGKLKTSTNC
jgi:hypothetical protein